MTILEPKAVRDSRNIDTFERGFVYAALALRASNTSPSNTPAGRDNKYFSAVQIIANLENTTEQGIEPSLTIRAKLPYDSQRALLKGGNFVESIGEYKNTNPGLSIKCKPSKPNYFNILTEPAWVNTLERYLVWCAHNLIEGHALLKTTAIPIASSFLEEDSLEPSLVIEATLKFDLFTYLNENNLISGIKSQIYSATEIGPEIFTSNSRMNLSLSGKSQIVAAIHSGSSLGIKVGGKSSSNIQVTHIQSRSTGSFLFGGRSQRQITNHNVTAISTSKLVMGGRSVQRLTNDVLAVTSRGNLFLKGTSAFVITYPGKEFKFITSGDINGVFYYYGTNFGVGAWVNPHTAQRLIASLSSSLDATHNNPQLLVDREPSHFIATSNTANSHFKIDLTLGKALRCSHYSLRGRTFDSNHLRNWALQGSNDDINWTSLDVQNNNIAIGVNTWFDKDLTLTNSTSYRYFRVLNTGLTSSNDNLATLGEIELYGILIGA